MKLANYENYFRATLTAEETAQLAKLGKGNKIDIVDLGSNRLGIFPSFLGRNFVSCGTKGKGTVSWPRGYRDVFGELPIFSAVDAEIALQENMLVATIPDDKFLKKLSKEDVAKKFAKGREDFVAERNSKKLKRARQKKSVLSDVSLSPPSAQQIMSTSTKTPFDLGLISQLEKGVENVNHIKNQMGDSLELKIVDGKISFSILIIR